MSSAVGNSYAASAAVANKFGANMNIPEMIMAIQIERSGILDDQIGDQMKDMQKRNGWLKDANAALNALRAARPSDKDGKVDYAEVAFTKSDGTSANALDWADENGIDTGLDRDGIAEAEDAKTALDGRLDSIADGDGALHEYPSFTDRDGNRVAVDDWGVKKGYAAFDGYTGDSVGYRSELTNLQGRIGDDLANMRGLDQSKFDAVIANAKSSIDTVNSQSQMDMVRLQGLMDKRGQAFDMMTNTLSKAAKSMDSIIGNMR